ncbi:MAG: UDP-N-acetylglucosamine 2-epimerase [Lentisphaerae bacterium GWF2_52_8]|nr:MAG: UDP-N-acetylglucosamine 2-epimerase [Lentisphaerae bacterium GWF2_52_8]
MKDTRKFVVSVVGARPNFIKVAPIHRAFMKATNIRHGIVHTGQHYDKLLSDVFFKDLGMPEPEANLAVGSGTHAIQTAEAMAGFESYCLKAKPDLVIVVGDVNSTLACALAAKKLQIPVAHIEAGLRSFDRTMPEEINRIATDAISDLAYTSEEAAGANLQTEGWPSERIVFVGNTMIDSLMSALRNGDSGAMERMGLQAGNYAVMTLHRPANVNTPKRLKTIINLVSRNTDGLKIVFPVHPRTKQSLEKAGIGTIPSLKLCNPLGYADFVSLLSKTAFAITDSGGIQEESTALDIPCITLRPNTERPVTVELGSNTLVDPASHAFEELLTKAVTLRKRRKCLPPLWDGAAAPRIAESLDKHLS